MSQSEALRAERGREMLLGAYQRVRRDTEWLCEPLRVDDYGVQTLAEASPPKWHLGHVTWFFETFLLNPLSPGYRSYEPLFEYLFNSYYNSVGAQWPRARRGELSRPTVDEVYAYRAAVDRTMLARLADVPDSAWPEFARRTELGLHHEQQHQELLLTDIKQNLSINPLNPAYRPDLPVPAHRKHPELSWLGFEAGEGLCGYAGGGFAFDNERPAHRARTHGFRLASRPVTNGEFIDFMVAGGYREPTLWLADGWAAVQSREWRAPLHWRCIDGEWFEYSLGGLRPLQLTAPVCHVSYFEADAYAAWVGKRLPSEQEWERAAAGRTVSGNFRDSGWLHRARSLNSA